MNRFLIIFSILVVTALAYTDARERLSELDAVAANTPSQVEMKPIFNNNAPEQKFENTDEPKQKQINPAQTQSEQINKNSKQNEQKLKDFQQDRNADMFR